MKIRRTNQAKHLERRILRKREGEKLREIKNRKAHKMTVKIRI